MRITFYLYPCLLFVALLGVQSFQFYRNRNGGPRRNASDDKDRHDAEAIRRFHAWLIWTLQLILSLLILASIIVTVPEAVAGARNSPGGVDFPFSAYLASYVGVLLYFQAGLLPDPEGPWSPGAAHCFAWVVAALVEAVIVAIFSAIYPSLQLSYGYIEVANALSLSRIAVLVLMIGSLLIREYRLRPVEPNSAPEERQSLLENGNGSAANYGAVPPSAPRRTQVAGTGWLEYFAGFKILFPYLWYAVNCFFSNSDPEADNPQAERFAPVPSCCRHLLGTPDPPAHRQCLGTTSARRACRCSRRRARALQGDHPLCCLPGSSRQPRSHWSGAVLALDPCFSVPIPTAFHRRL